MHVERTEAGLLVSLNGEFDDPQAAMLRQVLASEAPGKVTLDLTRSFGLPDEALVSLARALRAPRYVKVTLRGVTQHQARILHYCLARVGHA
jgi:hypothetical protein